MQLATIMESKTGLLVNALQASEAPTAHCLSAEEHCMMDLQDQYLNQLETLFMEIRRHALVQMDGKALAAMVSLLTSDQAAHAQINITVCTSSNACSSAYTSNQAANIGGTVTGGDTGSISVSPLNSWTKQSP